MKMLITAAAALCLTNSGFCLDAEEIKRLAEMPHSREGILEELKIYPDAREYEITVRVSKPGKTDILPPSVKAQEHVVEGKYVVSRVIPPGLVKEVIMVVTYDEIANVYRKWVLTGEEELIELVGTAVDGVRALAWAPVEAGEDGTSSLGFEFHTDEETKFRDVMLLDGKVNFITEGTAKKLK